MLKLRIRMIFFFVSDADSLHGCLQILSANQTVSFFKASCSTSLESCSEFGLTWVFKETRVANMTCYQTKKEGEEVLEWEWWGMLCNVAFVTGSISSEGLGSVGWTGPHSSPGTRVDKFTGKNNTSRSNPPPLPPLFLFFLTDVFSAQRTMGHQV